MRGYTLQKDDYEKRLARIEGQVRGLARMVLDGLAYVSLILLTGAVRRMRDT